MSTWLRHVSALLLGVLAWLCVPAQAAPPTPLPAEQAFRPSLVQHGEQAWQLRFDIAPGHYLYRERITLVTAGPGWQLERPPGTRKHDPLFGEVDIYPQPVTLTLRSDQPLAPGGSLTLQYQGCAEAGLCYPLQRVTLRPGESTPSNRPFSPTASWGATPASPLPLGAPPRPALLGHDLPSTLLLCFLAGLGLAFTACMYPLLPIVSSIVLHDARHGQRRAVVLSLAYIQGMALSYTGLGLLAAASGTFLAVTLQQRWVIAGFALFFVLLALAMFGLFSLQLPATWQSRLNDWANRLPGGRLLSVFVMGMLSALIIGPCIAPPLAALLVWLGQQGDLLLGGAALYALALGLGAPLLLIGILGASALPRLSPRPLHGMRIVFGLLLLGMAVWVARPLWQSPAPVAGLAFQSVDSPAALAQALQRARGKPVWLEFYADWCVSCIEFERDTLSDAGVKAQLGRFVLLRVDLSANTAAQRALLQQFGLYGPPAQLLFDRQGQLHEPKLLGTPDATEFSRALMQIP